jgi:hypothetical protein
VGRAAEVIDRITYRADGEGFLKPGYRHVFAVSADGGQPRQLTFGKFDDAGPISFTRDGKAVLFATNRAENWERDPQEAEVYQVGRRGRRADPLTTASARTGAAALARRLEDRLRRLRRRPQRGYENQRLYVMDRDGKNAAS